MICKSKRLRHHNWASQKGEIRPLLENKLNDSQAQPFDFSGESLDLNQTKKTVYRHPVELSIEDLTLSEISKDDIISSILDEIVGPMK